VGKVILPCLLYWLLWLFPEIALAVGPAFRGLAKDVIVGHDAEKAQAMGNLMVEQRKQVVFVRTRQSRPQVEVEEKVYKNSHIRVRPTGLARIGIHRAVMKMPEHSAVVHLPRCDGKGQRPRRGQGPRDFRLRANIQIHHAAR